VPAAFTTEELSDGAHHLTVIGRMKPGTDPGGVRANLDAVGRRIAPCSRRIATLRGRFVVAEGRTRARRGAAALLLAAVGVVLLITCANLGQPAAGPRGVEGARAALRGALGAHAAAS
jgi:hypothetical protein